MFFAVLFLQKISKNFHMPPKDEKNSGMALQMLARFGAQLRNCGLGLLKFNVCKAKKPCVNCIQYVRVMLTFIKQLLNSFKYG